MKKTATALVVLSAIALTACGSDTKTASGRFDEVKSAKAVKAVYKPATRLVTDYHNECQTKTRTKVVNKRTVVETYQDCSKVRVGTRTESYRKLVKPGKDAMYCVELDQVDGRNDVLFEVTHGTYLEFADKREGVEVKSMEYLRKVSHCRR